MVALNVEKARLATNNALVSKHGLKGWAAATQAARLLWKFSAIRPPA